jgi:hypothetical protein
MLTMIIMKNEKSAKGEHRTNRSKSKQRKIGNQKSVCTASFINESAEEPSFRKGKSCQNS